MTAPITRKVMTNKEFDDACRRFQTEHGVRIYEDIGPLVPFFHKYILPYAVVDHEVTIEMLYKRLVENDTSQDEYIREKITAAWEATNLHTHWYHRRRGLLVMTKPTIKDAQTELRDYRFTYLIDTSGRVQA